MSNPPTDRQKLRHYQAAFVEEFCTDKGNVPYLLQSGTGLGSSITVAHIVAQFMVSNINGRVLVLAPSPLHFQMQRLISGMDVTSRVIDRFRYRELVDATDSSSEIWARGEVSILSVDFAKKEDILDSLCTVSWTLIVVLEAHRISGQRNCGLNRLVKCSPSARLLLVSPVSLEVGSRIDLSAFKVVRWNPHEMKDAAGKPLFTLYPPVLRIVEVERENSEHELFQMIKDFSRKLKGIRGASAVSELTTRALASSPAAAEGILHRLRDRLVHSMPLIELTELEEESDYLEEFSGQSLHRDIGSVVQLIDTCLAHIDNQAVDSKLAQLTNLVTADCRNSAKSICVICSFRATVLYVQTRFEELDLPVNALHGSMSNSEQSISLGGFRDSGGVLVCTMPTIVGLDLHQVDSVLLYDLPGSRQFLHRLYALFERYGRSKPLSFIAFSDQLIDSNSILDSFVRLGEFHP